MKPKKIEDVERETGGERPKDGAPMPHQLLGPWQARALGDAFNLTQFGVQLETLLPGSKSSLRHWHSKSDEFVMVTEGELILHTNEGTSLMTPGMCIGFKAGVENGHHLINETEEPATFLVVGTRIEGDKATYPDDDFQWLKMSDGQSVPAKKDGSRFEQDE